MDFTSHHEIEAFAAVQHQHNAEFVSYCLATLGSPTISALLRALRRGYLRTLPRLTVEMVLANPPISVATAKGHLDLNRQGQRSTKPHEGSLLTRSPTQSPDSENLGGAEEEIEVDDGPPSGYSRMLELSNHSDLTGRFPVTSTGGNNYLLVSVMNGYVHIECMVARTAHQYVQAYGRTLKFYRDHGLAPKFQRLDNESSDALEKFLREQNLELQYVPPNNHRANKAERAIRDVKNHLIAMLATTHPAFPMSQWDELIPQCELTLNLLRSSSSNPEVSAYEAMYGKPYDFVAHPLAPCGTQVLLHDTPAKRGSWASHGVLGYYLGPALDGSYRSYRIFSVDTQSIRTTDTVAWLPLSFVMPGSSAVELLQTSIDDLAAAITTMAQSKHINVDSKEPLAAIGDGVVAALRDASQLIVRPTAPLGVPTHSQLPAGGPFSSVTALTTEPPGMPSPNTFAVSVSDTATDQRVATLSPPQQPAQSNTKRISRTGSKKKRQQGAIGLVTSKGLLIPVASRPPSKRLIKATTRYPDAFLPHLARSLNRQMQVESNCVITIRVARMLHSTSAQTGNRSPTRAPRKDLMRTVGSLQRVKKLFA